MVGGLVQRYDSGGGEVYTSGTLRKAGGGGSCLAVEGEVPYMKGQLYDLLNSERFTIDYNDFRNFNTWSAKIWGAKAPPPPPPPFHIESDLTHPLRWNPGYAIDGGVCYVSANNYVRARNICSSNTKP